jgi:predicted nucleic-acid-binding protein
MDKVYDTPKETINAMVRDFIAMPGVVLLQETNFSAVLSLWPATIADFGDALVASAGMAMKGAVIVTFDEKFKSALKELGLTVYQA